MDQPVIKTTWTDAEFETMGWGDSGNQTSMHLVSIGAITREVVADQKICLDRVYYRWRIETNWPSGEITFGATGFTQVLRQPPVLSDTPVLSPTQRQPHTGHEGPAAA